MCWVSLVCTAECVDALSVEEGDVLGVAGWCARLSVLTPCPTR